MTDLTDPRAADAMLVEVRGRLAAWLEDEARQARFPGEDDQEAYCEAMLEETLAADASRRLAAGGTARAATAATEKACNARSVRPASRKASRRSSERGWGRSAM
jgi:hypothetical protein